MPDEREHVTDGSPCWCGPTVEHHQAPELTPEAAELGQDPAAVSDPDFEAVKAGTV